MTYYDLENIIIDYYADRPEALETLIEEIEEVTGLPARDDFTEIDIELLLDCADVLEALPACLWDAVTEYRRETE